MLAGQQFKCLVAAGGAAWESLSMVQVSLVTQHEFAIPGLRVGLAVVRGVRQ